MKFVLLLLTALNLATSTSFAAPVGRFDLLCSGTRKEPPSQTEPFESHLVVDLTSKRFCIDDCTNSFPITSVDDFTFQYHYNLDKDGQHIPPLDDYNNLTYEDDIVVTFGNFEFGRKHSGLACVNCTAALLFLQTDSGSCKRMPFSGFKRPLLRPTSPSSPTP
jgi:hypothetical protein